MKRPARSPRISVGLECFVEQGSGEGAHGRCMCVNKVDVTSQPPIVNVRNGRRGRGHGHRGTRRPRGCSSLEVTVPGCNRTGSLYFLSATLQPGHTKRPSVNRYCLPIESALCSNKYDCIRYLWCPVASSRLCSLLKTQAYISPIKLVYIVVLHTL